VAVEYHNEDDFDSDGTIFENLEVKINQPDNDGIGEILVRGENITPGYYGNPELTIQAIDSDGFFHTGDLGKIVDQKIYVKGRKKRIILLSNGENIYPDDIEPLFEKYEHINKAKVYERNRQIFAIIYCDEIIDLEPIIKSVNLELPKYSRIQCFDQKLDQIGVRIK
jgi:long-chain acyl-CoA synthetase